MILAVGPGQRPYTLNQAHPDKDRILSAMKSFEPNACAEGCDTDYSTGTEVSDVSGWGYLYHDLLWTSEQVYNFEKHDLVLNPEFCEAILALAQEA